MKTSLDVTVRRDHYQEGLEALRRIKRNRKRERILSRFAVVLSAAGWFGVGFEIEGWGLGLGMGLGAAVLILFCLLRIEGEI